MHTHWKKANSSVIMCKLDPAKEGLHMCNFQTSVDERIAALRIFGLWLVLIFCEKRMTAYSEKLVTFNLAQTSVCHIFCKNVINQICYYSSMPLAYERTKDKDDVDNHKHLNGSESISLS